MTAPSPPAARPSLYSTFVWRVSPAGIFVDEALSDDLADSELDEAGRAVQLPLTLTLTPTVKSGVAAVVDSVMGDALRALGLFPNMSNAPSLLDAVDAVKAVADAAEREVFEYIVGAYFSPETCGRHTECVNRPNIGPLCAAQDPVRYRAHLYISKRFRERGELARQVVELLHMWGAFLEEQFVPTELEVYAEQHLSRHGFTEHGGPMRMSLIGGVIKAVRPGERGEIAITIPEHATLGPTLRDCVNVENNATLTRVGFREQGTSNAPANLWDLPTGVPIDVIIEALNPTDRTMDIHVAVICHVRCTRPLIDRTDQHVRALKAARVAIAGQRAADAEEDGSTPRPP